MVNAETLYNNSRKTAKSHLDKSSGFIRDIIPIIMAMSWKVLDCGSGKFRNTLPMIYANIDVNAYDPFMGEYFGDYYDNLFDQKLVTKKANDLIVEYPNDIEYDLVTSNYVLNVLPSDYRNKALDLLKGLNSPAMMIEVRAFTSKFPPGTWKEFDDGFITRTPTFQKPYDQESVLKLADRLNYNHRYIMKKGESLRLFLSEKHYNSIANDYKKV